MIQELGAGDVHDVAVKANTDPVMDFAKLLPLVLLAAENGDKPAMQVLERAGRELAETAAIVVERLFSNAEHVSIATHGGVFAGSVLVKDAFRTELHRLCPGAMCADVEVNPVLGALQRARREFSVWHKQGSAQ